MQPSVPGVVSGSAGIIIYSLEDGVLKVLRLHYLSEGNWLSKKFPVGRRDGGESLKSTAIRECEEEMGLRPDPSAVFWVYRVLKRDDLGRGKHEFELYAVPIEWCKGELSDEILLDTKSLIGQREWVTAQTFLDDPESAPYHKEGLRELIDLLTRSGEMRP